MIYKYTKCESVIAKIMADLDASEVRQRTSDIKEWIFEAIDKIGAPMQYITKQSGVDGVPIFELHENRIPLPSDLVHLDGVAFSATLTGQYVPCSTQTGTFKSPLKGNHNKIRIINEDALENLAAEKPDSLPELQQHKFPTIQPQINIDGITKGSKLVVNRDTLYDTKPEYFIKPGWMVFNHSHGFIKLVYKAIPTDERGYPLIPDLSSYQEAIYWYVTMKLNFPKFIKGQLGGKLKSANITIYNYMQNQWNFYRKQAYAEAMMPTADDMQNIKNDWNKLIPDWDGDDTFFKNIGQEQLTFNDYYNGC